MPPDDVYRRRLLLSVDARGYGGSDDLRQDEIQALLPDVMDCAAGHAGLHRADWDKQKAGDGELAVLPDTESEPGVVEDYVRELHRELGKRNRNLQFKRRLRLRLAIHHGVAKKAPMGYSGQGVVEVSRLADSGVVKAALDASGADLVVVLSRRVFEDTIAQPHTSLTVAQFRRVDVQNKELHDQAWLYVPGADVHALDLAGKRAAVTATATDIDPTPAEAGSTRPRGQRQVVKNVFPDATFNEAVFGIVNKE